MARQITLKEIADRTGVSVMTVSRALHNHPNLSADTRAAIINMAERLNYRPNPMISALMRYRGGGRPVPRRAVLGFITNFATRTGWRKSALNRQFYEGIVASAERQGYQVEEFWLREARMNPKRLSQILHTRNVPGLLIAPLAVPIGHLRLDWDKFAIVALGYSLAWPSVNRVVDQQFHSTRLALHQLRKLGYQRPGLAVRASFNQVAHNHWSAAFLVEQQSRQPSQRVPLFVVTDREFSESNFHQWLHRYRPDVVMGLEDQVLDWLRHADLRVPEDVGFAHLDCPDRSGRFAGICRNGQAVGAAAVDFLIDMIHRNERGIPLLPKWILVEGTWQAGGTLREKK